MDANVRFDTDYGSGTPMGSGEENIFMYDCLKKGLRAYYVPIDIGEVKQVNSKWFRGFTEDYFWKRGKIIRRMMGCWGCFFTFYILQLRNIEDIEPMLDSKSIKPYVERVARKICVKVKYI